MSPPRSLDFKEVSLASSAEIAVEVSGKHVELARRRVRDESPPPPSDRFVRHTLRRVDLRLLPLLILVYALALMDRNNLGVAAVAGLERDLGLAKSNRFNVASAIYFVPYILFELPSNLVLRRTGPRAWLAFITIVWGFVQLLQGFVKTWQQLVLCRFFLGAGEAGFFPAITYIIQTWYTRYEVQTRLALFYVVALFIGALNALVCYGLSFLDGVGGQRGWQWIFIVQGASTILAGLLVAIWVVDFPDQNNFLTQKETELILTRVEYDRGDSVPDKPTFRKVVKHLSDWKIWIFGLMFMTQTAPGYVVGFFLTIMLRNVDGWSSQQALLMSAPPHGFAVVFALFAAWLSDRARLRAPFLAAQTLVTSIGLVMDALSSDDKVKYAGFFLVTAGSASCIPGVLAYAANNVTTQSKRAVSSAIIIAFGGVGGIIATTVFREQDVSIGYRPGFWVILALQGLNLVLLAVTTVYFRRKNWELKERTIGPIEGQVGFYYTL